MSHNFMNAQTAVQLIDYIASLRIPSDTVLTQNKEIRQVMVWANEQQRWDILINIAYHVTRHFAYPGIFQKSSEKDGQATKNQLWLQGVDFALAGLTASLRAKDKDPYHEKLFLDYLSRLSQNLRNYETARQYFESQLAVDNDLQSKFYIGEKLYLLGHEANDAQQFSVARKCYQKSVDIYQSMGNLYAMANIMQFMAVNEEQDGNLDLMQYYIEQSDSLMNQFNAQDKSEWPQNQ